MNRPIFYAPQLVALYSGNKFNSEQLHICWEDYIRNAYRHHGHWHIHSPGDFIDGKKAFKKQRTLRYPMDCLENSM